MTCDLASLLAAHDRARGAAVLKDDGRVRVTRIPFDATSDAVVKEDRRTSVRARLGRLLRGSRAERSAAAAAALAAAGFAVPEPLGVLRRCYVARHDPSPTLTAALRDASPTRRRRLLALAARLVARLRLAGFAPRDLKPPNLLVRGDRLVLVDLDDIRRRPPRGPRDPGAVRNLAALDAYSQAGERPPGVRARWAALAAYHQEAGADARVWRDVLRASRARRLPG